MRLCRQTSSLGASDHDPSRVGCEASCISSLLTWSTVCSRCNHRQIGTQVCRHTALYRVVWCLNISSCELLVPMSPSVSLPCLADAHVIVYQPTRYALPVPLPLSAGAQSAASRFTCHGPLAHLPGARCLHLSVSILATILAA